MGFYFFVCISENSLKLENITIDRKEKKQLKTRITSIDFSRKSKKKNQLELPEY